MKIRFSRLRTFLLTLSFGFAAISVCARLSGYLEEVHVDVPKVQSDTPIMIRLCGEWGSRERYSYAGNTNSRREKPLDCYVGGGGG